MGTVGYYRLREQTALEILAVEENRPKYKITLWWGFDGLREGDDGLWHWVSRRKKDASISVPITPWPSILNASQMDVDYGLCQSSDAERMRFSCAQSQNMTQGLGHDATIRQLQMELANVNCQIAFNERHAYLMNQLTQCCVNRF